MNNNAIYVENSDFEEVKPQYSDLIMDNEYEICT